MDGWGGQKGAGFENKSHSCHKCPSRFNPCLRFPGCPESTASLFLGAIHHHAMVLIPSSQSSLLPPSLNTPTGSCALSLDKCPQIYACGACQDDAWGGCTETHPEEAQTETHPRKERTQEAQDKAPRPRNQETTSSIAPRSGPRRSPKRHRRDAPGKPQNRANHVATRLLLPPE